MNRREALSAVTFLLGGTVIGAEVFLSGCGRTKDEVLNVTLSDDDIRLLNDIGETILPATTSSPGAREANVGAFMKSIVSDCYSAEEQKIFQDGLLKLNAATQRLFGNNFGALDEMQRHEFILGLERESANYKSTKTTNDPNTHYYTMIKQLSVWGFLSSEAGATKALRHVAVPGRFDGCIPFQPGEKAWG